MSQSTLSQKDQIAFFTMCCREFECRAMPFEVIKDAQGDGISFTVNGYSYAYYPNERVLLEHEVRRAYKISVAYNTAPHIINHCWELVYRKMVQRDELFAEMARFQAEQAGLKLMIKNPLGELIPNWNIVSRDIFEDALRATQGTKLLREAQAILESKRR